MYPSLFIRHWSFFVKEWYQMFLSGTIRIPVRFIFWGNPPWIECEYNVKWPKTSQVPSIRTNDNQNRQCLINTTDKVGFPNRVFPSRFWPYLCGKAQFSSPVTLQFKKPFGVCVTWWNAAYFTCAKVEYFSTSVYPCWNIPNDFKRFEIGCWVISSASNSASHQMLLQKRLSWRSIQIEEVNQMLPQLVVI